MEEEVLTGVNQFIGQFFGFAPRILMAILVLFIGLWIIRILDRFLCMSLERRGIDDNLRPFLKSLVGVVLKISLFVSVIGMLGVQTTSFVALLGAAGLAVGLSLQGSLANFAGGVLILLFRPFRVGDFIETQGYSGSVREIQIFNTVLSTPDNRRVILPNGAVAGNSLVNFSAETTRRLDLNFGVSYSDDLSKVRRVIQEVLAKDGRVKSEPEPLIVVSSLGDSSVNFLVRVWVNSSDFWAVNFSVIENMKIAFDEAGISIPFPQRELHLRDQKQLQKGAA
ncbi:MAG: mechanosensitive ion channel family protein [Bradymonadales bacterium]|nr:MAG: mechanosensitive ion channel family protein [Bradymonadales bacterium]